MSLPNLGINSESIQFEVALEKLGQSKQLFIQEIGKEKEKPVPSLAYIQYCESRKSIIDDLQDTLDPNDRDTILKILEDSPAFVVPRG
ncbi:MAG: antitoxin [Deltaproteobacteria bacterium]|nr:antitoxin [Deltaproteobacteria bacterium]